MNTEAMQHLMEAAHDNNIFAQRALDFIARGIGVIVPCTYRRWDAPGYNAVASPVTFDGVDYDYAVYYAPFSPNAPGRVGAGDGDNHSWMVVTRNCEQPSNQQLT